MNIAGSLNYDTKVDTKGLKKGADEIKSKSRDMVDSMKIAVGNIISELAKLGAKALGKVVEVGLDYNKQIEKYQTALTTLTGSAEKASGIIEQIKKDAAATPFDINSLVSANQLLISAGVSADRARTDIINLGNAISATGGGSEELARMAVNLQQIKNVGQATALDIKQFAYAGIDVYGLLADATGKTRKEVSNMKVTYNDLTKALANASQEGGRYAGAMEAQSKTFNGLVSTLKDNLNALAGQALEPMFNLIRNDILPTILQIIKGEGDIDGMLNDLGQKLGDFIGKSLNSLIKLLPKFIEYGITIILALINGLTQQIPELIPTIIDAVFLIIDTLLDNLDEIIIAGIDIIIALIEGLTSEKAMSSLVNGAIKVIGTLIDYFTKPETLAKLIEASVRLVFALLNAFINLPVAQWNSIKELPKKIKNAFIERVNEFKTAGKDLLQGLWNGIKEKWESLKKKVEDLGKGIVNKFKSVFGIKSPSRVMRDLIGKQLTAGIAVGIETNTDEVDSAIDDLNDDIINRMTKAVTIEAGKSMFSGTNGTVTQMLSAFGTTTVVNENKLYLDGDEIYENQQTVSAKKNLQTQFGGGYSVSS